MAIHNFREMKIWKESIRLVKNIYVFTGYLPREKTFNLISQMNRSSVSIPSNIAEGSVKTTNKDFKRFLDISIASSYELETQLILANEIYQIEINELVTEIYNLQNRIIGFERQLND
jgi:four helix bundle protein